MIEKYPRINRFIPSYFNNRTEKEQFDILKDAKIVNDISDITIDNYMDKINMSIINLLMEYEFNFVKDRNDSQINKSEYISSELQLDEINKISYNIRNNNGEWNVNLSLVRSGSENRSDNRKINFVLRGDTCRINHVVLENKFWSQIKGEELIKYFNGFISLYPNKIKKVEISDFAYNLDYSETRKFVEKYTKSLMMMNRFLIKPADFTKQQYDEALDKLEDSLNSLSLDDKIKFNQNTNDFSKNFSKDKNNFSVGHGIKIVR